MNELINDYSLVRTTSLIMVTLVSITVAYVAYNLGLRNSKKDVELNRSKLFSFDNGDKYRIFAKVTSLHDGINQIINLKKEIAQLNYKIKEIEGNNK